MRPFALIKEFASLLPGVTASAVPDLLARLPDIGSRMQDPKGTLLTPRQRTQRAGHLVASALALALLDKGWQLETKPGLFYLYRGQDQADPFAMVSDLIDGKVAKDVWLDTCTRLGIGDALLVPPGYAEPG